MLLPVRSLSRSVKLACAGVLLGLVSQTWALNKVITVSATAGKGNFTTIQDAINSCDPLQDVCQINLLDPMFTLKAPLWIEGKANITLTTASATKSALMFDPALYAPVANPNAADQPDQATVAKIFTLSWADISGVADPTRPAGWLMWPKKGNKTCSTPTIGPMGLCSDTTSKYSTSGFQHNGMIVVKKSRDITIKNLKLVGKTGVFFHNTGIWGGEYDIVHGMVGIDIFQSLRTTVDGNDIGNFFSALYINGRNVGGMFGTANPDDWDVKDIVPLSRYGQVGNHIIQKNYFHDNWWAMYQESSWDLASRIHHNVSYNNMNKAFQYPDSAKDKKANSNEMSNQAGGFMYMKDAVLATDRIYNNTILRSPMVIGCGGWRAGSQELFYNNVVRMTAEVDKSTANPYGLQPGGGSNQKLQYYGATAWDNTIQLIPGVSFQTKDTLTNVNIKDPTLVGLYGATSTCASPCNFSAPVHYYSQIQPNKIWNAWGVHQGVTAVVRGEDLIMNGKSITTIATASGYQGKIYTVSDNNGYNAWGVIDQLPASGTPATLPLAMAQARNNMFAFRLNTMQDSTALANGAATLSDSAKLEASYKVASPTTIMKLAPQWSMPEVAATIRNQAWNQDNFGNKDGSPSDRGAFCFDTLSGKTTLGCDPTGAILSLVDQQIVSVNQLTAKIPVIVQQIDGTTGAATSGYTANKIDSIYYYDAFPYSTLPLPGATAADEYQKMYANPVKITNTVWSGVSGDMATLTLPNAVTNDYARFDVFMSAINPATGKRVSVIGVYFYRKLQYQMVVKFCSTAACTDSITSARVGDPIYMQAYVTDAKGVKLSTQQVSRVYATPGAGVKMRNLTTPPGSLVDTSQILSGFTGSFVLPVDFETKGNLSVTVTGVVGAATSAVGVMGNGSIKIRPGLPAQVQFVIPQTYQVTKCNGNPSDTANGCNELQGVAANQGTLVVYDKYGNTVDTAASVSVNIDASAYSGTIAAASPIAGSLTGVGATVATVAKGVNSVVIKTDSVGNADFGIIGDPSAQGALLYKTAVFPWVKLTGSVMGVAGALNDTAYARLLPPSGHLEWASPARIDTFILTPRPVVIWLTKDGATADAANPNANSYVSIAATSSYIKYYSDSTMKTLINPDSIKLSSGQARFWVAATRPTAGFDSLIGSIPGLKPSNALPAQFVNPPLPPTPTMLSSKFLDANCDGLADSVLVTFDPAGAVKTLDPAKVRINSIVFQISPTENVVVDSTAIRLIPGGASVAIALPVAVQSKFVAFNPAASLTLGAALIIPPAPDSMVVMGSVKVGDGIGPRPTAAVLVENPDPATTPDVLTVAFSEPVTMNKVAGAYKWPFQTLKADPTSPSGMSSVSGAGITVQNVEAGDAPNSLKFTLTGNTNFALAENTILAIEPGTGLTDAAGNDSRINSGCGKDTALVKLKAVVVEVSTAAILDKNGDGRADYVRVVFRRDFRKATERPDSMIVSNWVGAPSVSLSFATADSVGVGTYELKLPSSFPVGATVGAGTAGVGSLEVYRGLISALNPIERKPLADSVPPIAVGVAKIEFGTAGDKITVTYSEAMTLKDASLDAMVMKTAGGDVVRTFSGATKDATGKIWTFNLASGSLQVGDSIRLPKMRSMLIAENGGIPSSLGAAPYVPVVGGDRAPDSAKVLDLNGDGTGDAVQLFYSKPTVGNPTFSFTWGGTSVTIDSVGYKSSVAGQASVTIPVSGFPALVTSGVGSATSTSFVEGAAVTPIGFSLKDGIAAVIDRALVTYGQEEGAPDTLHIKLSEPVAALNLAAGSLVLANHNGSVALVQADQATTLTLVFVPNSSEFSLVCASEHCKLPGFGDFVRLATGSASDLAGNTEGDSSRWAKVLTGPKPVRYHADIFPKAVVEFPKPGNNPMRVVTPVSTWVRPEGDSTWTAQGTTASQWTGGKINVGDISAGNVGLAGIKLDLNNSLDAQFLAYDNLGTFVGKADVKIDVDVLNKAGLSNSANKYSLFVALNGLNAAGGELASGVYMIRVITYTEQVVNGELLRLMNQNKVFKLGVYNKLK